MQVYKKYTEELLSEPWFSIIMLDVGHNMAHTISHFLLDVLKV